MKNVFTTIWCSDTNDIKDKEENGILNDFRFS